MTLKGQIKVIQSLRAHILETMPARHLATIKHVEEIIYGGSNGTIGFDLG